MLIRLSHPLTRVSPLYPGSPEVSFTSVKSIANNDSANTSRLSFGSHSGTHIDAPLHFCDHAGSIVDTLDAETRFTPTICIDIAKEPHSYISRIDLEPFVEKMCDAEAILIRTGFFKYREVEPDVYTSGHPWLHPDVPEYLRNICPRLKLIGLDTISISNPSHRDEGRAAHRAFLCGEHPVLLLEDADLSDVRLSIRAFELYLYPWILDGLDGTPVTALAVL